MADDSVLRVRLDVDESDVSKLKVGQRAYVTAEAYGTHKFWGHVIRVGRILGKKNVRTDEPSEHVDTKILETLVELEPGAAASPWPASRFLCGKRRAKRAGIVAERSSKYAHI